MLNNHFMWRPVTIGLLLLFAGCGGRNRVVVVDDQGSAAPDAAIPDSAAPDRAPKLDLPPPPPIPDSALPPDGAPVKLADLALKSFSAYVTPNTSYVYYYFTVCNLGQTYSSPTSLTVHINASSPPTGPGDLSLSLIGLAPGDCLPETATTQLPKGSYSSWAIVDPENKEKEIDESNNTSGPIQVLVSATSGVDLLVTALSLVQGPAGQSVAATVCNKGGAAASTAVLDLYLDSQAPPSTWSLSDASKTIALAGSSCAQVDFGVALKPGTYQSWAWVDRKNVIAELDENNNLSGPFPLFVSP